MAVYEDFSKYEKNGAKLENVINIGWLGEAGKFPKGHVSEEFIMNLWEYYKCPFFPVRKVYQNENLDGYWKFYTAKCNGREIALGSSEVRIFDQKRGVIYASPNLIIHYILNHKYLPPQEYIKAVIEGSKPNSRDYCNMISCTYKHVKKVEGRNGRCPFCHGKYADFAYKEKKNHSDDQKLVVIENSKIGKKKNDLEKYVYYFMCKDCGRLFEVDLASLVCHL